MRFQYLTKKVCDGAAREVNSFFVEKFLRRKIELVKETEVLLFDKHTNCLMHKASGIITTVDNRFLVKHLLPDNYKNHNAHIKFSDLIKIRFSKQKTAAQIPKAFIWGNNWSAGYYHLIIEDLPKIIYAQQQNLPVYSWFVPTATWQKDIFRLFNIQSQVIKEPILVNELHYISKNRIFISAAKFSIPNPELLQLLQSRLRQIIINLKIEKNSHIVWISRQYSLSRHILNEEECILALRKKGYTVTTLFPEKMSIVEQINKLYNANYVVGPHGAGLCSIVFTHHAHLVEIGPAKTINPSFSSVAIALNRKYHYLKTPVTNKLLQSRSNYRIADIENFINELLSF